MTFEALTSESHLGSKKINHSKGYLWLPIWLLWTPSLYLAPFSRYSTSMYLGFDLDLWPPKVIWGQKKLYHSKGHIWLPIWLLWTPSLYLAPFSRYSTSMYLGFDLDFWPLKVNWGQKKLNHSKGHIWFPIWLLWTPSRTVFEIFDFKVFTVWPWPLTPRSHLGSKKLYHSKSHIWLPIWLLWAPSLYLVPFSRYSNSKFLGFELDLWPLKIIWGRKKLYHSKSHIWLPIWLLWTPSLYLVPFSRYSTSKFLGFDLDLWPLKVIWGQKTLYHSKGHIWLPIWLLWTPSLYLVPFSRYSTSKFLGFDLDLWPLKVIWGRKQFMLFERPYMTSYLTSMDTISLSRTVLEIMPVKILKAEQNGGFWPFKGQGSIFSNIEKALPLTKRRRLRYCASKSVQPFRLCACLRA